MSFVSTNSDLDKFSYLKNYSSNEIMDILLTLGECNRNYRRASHHYAELYPNCRHSSARQVINIGRRVYWNTLHRQRQINRLPNNNDPKLLTILSMVHFNPHQYSSNKTWIRNPSIYGSSNVTIPFLPHQTGTEIEWKWLQTESSIL